MQKINTAFLCISLFLMVTACSNEANHMGNPLLLPISALSNTAQNSVYYSKRKEVQTCLGNHYDQIEFIIRTGVEIELPCVEIIPYQNRAALRSELSSQLTFYFLPTLSFSEKIERLTISYMAHAG